MDVRTLKPHDLVDCLRCGKTEFVANADKWNVVFDEGVAVGFICHDCQTDEEDLEAQVNEATINYSEAKTVHNLQELLEGFRPLWREALGVIANGEVEKGNALLWEYVERFRKAHNAMFRYDFNGQIPNAKEAYSVLVKLGEMPEL